MLNWSYFLSWSMSISKRDFSRWSLHPVIFLPVMRDSFILKNRSFLALGYIGRLNLLDMLPGDRPIDSTDIDFLDNLRNILFVVIFQIERKIFLESPEATRIVLSILTKRLREPPINDFLLNNLKKIIDHFCFIPQLRWHISVGYCSEM